MAILQFPPIKRRRSNHDRPAATSEVSTRRADIPAKILSVRPAVRATFVSQIADHHSEGMLSRWGHLRTAAMLCPISAASASGESQRPTTSRNDLILDAIESELGHYVLIRKAILSHDCEAPSSDNRAMAGKKTYDPAASAYIAEFVSRVRRARKHGGYTQAELGKLLGVDQGTYKQYEAKRETLLPHHLIPKFCIACGVNTEWLFGISAKGGPQLPKPQRPKKEKIAANPRQRPAAA